MDATMTLEERCKIATGCLPQAEYQERLEALHADLLALRQDAERYRWLRDDEGALDKFTAYYWNTKTSAELDAALDAAMAAGET